MYYAGECARYRHRRVPHLVELRQAPALGAGRIQRTLLRWCWHGAGTSAKAAWARLGLALTGDAVQDMVRFVQSQSGEEAARKVERWVNWWRLQPRCRPEAFEGALRDSPMKGMWAALCRYRPMKEGRRHRRVSSAPGVSSSTREPAQGIRAVEVGRAPLHAVGTLPEVIRARGLVQQGTWSLPAPRTAAARFPCLLKCRLHATKKAHGGCRGILSGLALGEEVRQVILACGGEMIVPLPKLLAASRCSEKLSRRALAALSRQEGCTLTASRSCVVVRVAVCQGTPEDMVVETLSSQDWATLLGVPVGERHLRRGLQAVTESQGRAIIGQAVHFEVVKGLIQSAWNSFSRRRGDSWSSRPSYVSLFSGIDVGAAAMEACSGGRWRFRLAAEVVVSVRRALLEAWGWKLERCSSDAFSGETRAALWAMRGEVDFCCLSWRCAPWSSANTVPLRSEGRREELLRAVEEMQELVRVATLACPWVILIECVDGLLARRFRRHWAWVSGYLLLQSDWVWSWQLVNPADAKSGAWPRRRLWIMGVRR